jgi:hypothetical protein
MERDLILENLSLEGILSCILPSRILGCDRLILRQKAELQLQSKPTIFIQTNFPQLKFESLQLHSRSSEVCSSVV